MIEAEINLLSKILRLKENEDLKHLSYFGGGIGGDGITIGMDIPYYPSRNSALRYWAVVVAAPLMMPSI